MRLPRVVGGCVLWVCWSASGVVAQSHHVASATGVDTSFVRRAEQAMQRFRDPRIALAEGYRPIGPDFPAMGVHWVNVSQVFAPALDPTRPAILTYTTLGGRSTFLGGAYIRVLAPDESPPDWPFPAGAWHDHSKGLDEESLVIASPLSVHDSGRTFRVAMIHLWTDVPSPDGRLAQNNWALPFLRAGLPIPDSIPLDAARALSLANGGVAFYDEVVRAGAGVGTDEAAWVHTLLAHVADQVTEWIALPASRTASIRQERLAELEIMWRNLWTCLAASLDAEVLDRLDVLEPTEVGGTCDGVDPLVGSTG